MCTRAKPRIIPLSSERLMERRTFLKLFALPAIPTGIVVTAISTPAPLTIDRIVNEALLMLAKETKFTGIINRQFDELYGKG